MEVIKPNIIDDKKHGKDEDFEITACPNCNLNMQEPYWESRYNGVKAKCNTCDVTWNLS